MSKLGMRLVMIKRSHLCLIYNFLIFSCVQLIDSNISQTEHTFLSAHQVWGRKNTYKRPLYDHLNTAGLFRDILISVNDKIMI